MKIIKTPWGSSQYEIDGQPMLAREVEAALRQEWRTQPEFWAVLDDEFDFQLDAAASEPNKLTEGYLSSFDDALAPGTAWVDQKEPLPVLRVYCNPGFNDIGPWMAKAALEAAKSPSAIVAVLGLCAPSTDWWANALCEASEVRMLAPRIQFDPPDPRIPRSSNSRENALFIFRGSKIINEQARTVTWRWK
jgi:phage N-6-adenine-methyltransferase